MPSGQGRIKADLKVRFIPVTSRNRIALVQNGTVDIECGVTTNLKTRQAQVAFSYTFFVATTRLLTRKDSGVKDFADLVGKTVVTNQGTTSERILRKMNEEKKMNMQLINAKDYGEGRLTLETGRAAAYMIDDVLLAGTRSLSANSSDYVLVGTAQLSEAYGFIMRRDDPAFKKLVDDTLAQIMAAVAKCIGENIGRLGDSAAHYGDEDLAVTLPSIDPTGAVQVPEKNPVAEQPLGRTHMASLHQVVTLVSRLPG